MARRAWEQAKDWGSEDEGYTGHAWEEDELPIDYGDLTPAEHGDMLAELLIKIKFEARCLTAKDVCVIAFHAHGAGAVGPVSELAHRPDDEGSGHYARAL